MGTWRAIADIAGPVAAGALLVVLVGAAIERGRIHYRAALRPGLREDAAALLACAFEWRRTLSCSSGAGSSTAPVHPGRPTTGDQL